MSVNINKAWQRLAGLLMLLVSGSALAEYKLNFQDPVTPIAREIFDLHMLIFWICVVISIIVFGAMIYSMIMHRKSKGAVVATFHENTKLEILWTVIPFIILVSIAIPATSTLLKIEDTSDADITVKITGLQWKWKYELDADGTPVTFLSSLDAEHNKARQLNSGTDVTNIKHYLQEVDNRLVLPVNKKVRFLITSDDVIHSWWIPAFGTKKDAIPGYVNEAQTFIEKEGTYRGECAELCGKDHAFMPIVVDAVSEDKFNTWLAAKKVEAVAAAAEASASKIWSREELMARGSEIYSGKGGCFGCHGANGEGVAVFPALAGSPIATGPAAAHTNVVVHGRPGTAMAAYGNQLNDLELAAVITFERNSWGNSGSVVQPADVKAAR